VNPLGFFACVMEAIAVSVGFERLFFAAFAFFAFLVAFVV
jgi:hypothetical protein